MSDVLKQAASDLGLDTQDLQFIEEMSKAASEKGGVEVQMNALNEGARNLDSYAKEASNGLSAREALQAGLGGSGSRSAAYERGRGR